MSSTILALSNLLRGLASLLILGLLGVGGWVIYEAHHMQALLNRELQETTAELSKHKAQVEHLTNENQRIALALRLLTIDHRVAEIEVLNQREGQKHLTTTFRFIELTKDGHPIGEVKEFTVEGDTIYIDALVIKHADSLIDKGDPLRSTSVCLFRRVFGEYQEPSKGFPLDPWSSRPAVYSQGNEISPLERDIWANIWEYANNPAKMEKAGLRAAHGETPSVRLELGKRYKLELRASAGLSIVTDDLPEKPAS